MPEQEGDTTLVWDSNEGTEERRTGEAYVTIVSGEAERSTYEVRASETVFGRGSDTDVRLGEGDISREHAKIVRHPDGTVKLVDLGSSNGTFVNGTRISAEVLRDGDKIRLGRRTRLYFRYEYQDHDVEGDEAIPDAVAPDATRVPGDARSNYERALESYKRTLTLREQRFGEEHSFVADVLGQIGGVLRELERFEEAVAFYQRAVGIYDQVDGDAPTELAEALLGLGMCHLAGGSAPAGVPSLERALSLLQGTTATEAELAPTQFQLARALERTGGDRRLASTLALKARRGFEKGGPELSGMVASVDEWLAAQRVARDSGERW